MLKRSEELDRFKTDINLTEYAASQGYELVRAESSRNSVVMASGGDKVVIARNQDSNHWMYFSVRDDDDNGTIVDFVLKRQEQENMGLLRKALRPWIGESNAPLRRPPVSAFAQQVERVNRDKAKVIEQYSQTRAIEGEQPYLQQGRTIPAETLQSPRFAGKIRIDERGNAVFPHADAGGLCGFEKKNRDFTGFASGGTKGIWSSAANKRDHTLVITEGAIDALSYFTLYRPAQARYISIGGAMNLEQPELIERAIGKLSEGATLILAFDNDAGGDELLTQVRAIAASAGRTDIQITDHRPPERGQDWNDVLRHRVRHPVHQPTPAGRAR